jgi:hypothetical protein
MKIEYTSTGAEISGCGRFRYLLTREWDSSLPACAFIGLNPSTADGNQDDPTIRRCVSFAASWGYGKLYMLNLHPYRATNPADMLADLKQESSLPIAEICSIWAPQKRAINHVRDTADIAVAAWGSHAKHPDLKKLAASCADFLGPKLFALSLTKDGHPAHPLYLKKTLRPFPFHFELYARALAVELKASRAYAHGRAQAKQLPGQ